MPSKRDEQWLRHVAQRTNVTFAPTPNIPDYDTALARREDIANLISSASSFVPFLLQELLQELEESKQIEQDKPKGE